MDDRNRHRRAYLSAEQLSELTLWTVDAIHKLVQRGILKKGVHYFQPGGRRSRLIFKWDAIVSFVEGSVAEPAPVELKAERLVLDVAKAETGILRLLD